MTTTSQKRFRKALSLAAFTSLIASVTLAFAAAPASATHIDFGKPKAALARSPAPMVRLAEAPAKRAASTNATRQGPTGVVNINSASASELTQLPGIGPKKAALIVTWRTKHGKFNRVVDLRRVKGFGPKSVKKLKPHLAVTGKSTFSK